VFIFAAKAKNLLSLWAWAGSKMFNVLNLVDEKGRKNPKRALSSDADDVEGKVNKFKKFSNFNDAFGTRSYGNNETEAVEGSQQRG
jgi:nicotinic acid phosphoribosyltransferase